LKLRPSLRTYSRTYSKRKLQDGLDNTFKRRRISIVKSDESHNVPSSDLPLSDLPSSDVALFSDENIPPSTPPSSPPSLPISPRAVPPKLQLPKAQVDESTSDVKSTPNSSKPLVQMQLNFGQSMRKTCKECRMEYVPSAPEDVALHKKFHAQHINGVSMDRDLLTKVKSEKAVWLGPQGDFIISLSGSQDPKHWLKKARAVFDMATSDLGAVDIPDEKLWGVQSNISGAQNKATDAKEETNDRYKLYLYMDNGRCVGLCLAEGIDKAFRVVEPERKVDKEKASDPAEAQRSELLSISQDTDEAAIGISRIWTSRGSRKKGIARALLKCVAKTFLSKVTPKDMVAFSQPTEMGTALARRWFGQEYGWHVYID
jgi:N-acetyltransferase